MKFFIIFVFFNVFLASACSFSIAGKVLDKINKIRDWKKDDKKPDNQAGKNISHGFIPSQIKCEFVMSTILGTSIQLNTYFVCFYHRIHSHIIRKMWALSTWRIMRPSDSMSGSFEDDEKTSNVWFTRQRSNSWSVLHDKTKSHNERFFQKTRIDTFERYKFH